MMTGLLTAEQGNLSVKVRVPVAATMVEPTRDDLRAGGRYTRRMLLNSALIISANDSAYTLGYDLGGGSMRRFYGAHERRRGDLGMVDTHYASANGLDDKHNRSSANDQAIMAWYALGDPTFRKVVVDEASSACRGRRRSTSRSTGTTTGCCSPTGARTA